MDVRVELLLNPFCLADRDSRTVSDVCKQMGVICNEYNMWDIDDNSHHVPAHVAKLADEYRTGQRPGSVYSSAFVNGQRLFLNKWSGSPTHLDTLRSMIAKAREEGAQ